MSTMSRERSRGRALLVIDLPFRLNIRDILMELLLPGEGGHCEGSLRVFDR